MRCTRAGVRVLFFSYYYILFIYYYYDVNMWIGLFSFNEFTFEKRLRNIIFLYEINEKTKPHDIVYNIP